MRNKLKPAVTLTTVEVGANFVSNPRQLANTDSSLSYANLLLPGAAVARSTMETTPPSTGRSMSPTSVCSGHSAGAVLHCAKGQFQADDTRLNTQTVAVESGPVFQLTPDVWLHVAGGGEMVWLDEKKLQDDVTVSATVGGLFRG